MNMSNCCDYIPGKGAGVGVKSSDYYEDEFLLLTSQKDLYDHQEYHVS